MAKLVDATDLIGLSLGMETYQVITFKFRETLELTMGNPEPNPKSSESENKKDRCRDSMEAVLTNGVDDIYFRVGLGKESFHRNFVKDQE
ncbi:hypothetical protein Lal_00033158 [Lupinus albus]|nr:hypothetical protein Lal_00033158 [Lupinus albus]